MEEDNKKVCPSCGKIHDNEEGFYELAKITAEPFTDEFFPSFWQERKEELKQMTKREATEEAFFSGAISMLHTYMLTMADLIHTEDEDSL